MEKLKKGLKGRKIIIPVIVLLIVIFAIIIIIHLTNGKQMLTSERANQLLNNSYIYYMLSSGNAPLKDKMITYKENKYYKLDMDLHSIKEIKDLISDTFVESESKNMFTKLYSIEPDVKNIKVYKDELYIKNIAEDNPCKNIKLDGTAKVVRKGKKVFVRYQKNDRVSYSQEEAVYENGKWVLYKPIKVCFSTSEAATEVTENTTENQG